MLVHWTKTKSKLMPINFVYIVQTLVADLHHVKLGQLSLKRYKYKQFLTIYNSVSATP